MLGSHQTEAQEIREPTETGPEKQHVLQYGLQDVYLCWNRSNISAPCVVRQQPPLPPILTHYILIMYAKPFQTLLALCTVRTQVSFTLPATAILLDTSIFLLSAVDPFGTGGHGDPNRGTLPGETGHQYVTVDFPFFIFPTLLYTTFL